MGAPLRLASARFADAGKNRSCLSVRYSSGVHQRTRPEGLPYFAADLLICAFLEWSANVLTAPGKRTTPRRCECGRSAAGSAPPCQGGGRGFESRRPLGGVDSNLFTVEWPRGEATACKAVYTGSNPVPTSARLAQRESASLTRKRSLVRSQYRPPKQGNLLDADITGQPAWTS